MRRFAILGLSLSMLLALSGAPRVSAQDEPKKEEAKTEPAPAPAPAPAPEAKKGEPKAETPASAKAEAPTPTAEPVKPIPPEVEAKLEAARKAVAEAIVAAQDAGLVDSSIDPPPILDILITGRATDAAAVKARTGVSPEVFGAWFTGFGKTEGVNAQTDIRIIQPADGLRAWYEQRATFLNREIEAARKAKGAAAPAPAEAPKAETPKEEPKPEAPTEEPKPEAPKAEEPKPEAPKAEEPKPEAPKAEEPKVEAPK